MPKRPICRFVDHFDISKPSQAVSGPSPLAKKHIIDRSYCILAIDTVATALTLLLLRNGISDHISKLDLEGPSWREPGVCL